jgi:hypothetical protein
MATYRVGNHHGVTIVRLGDGARCGRPEHDCDRGHLVGVMLTAEDAALVVEALHHVEQTNGPALPIRIGGAPKICTCPLNARTCPRHGAASR